MEGFKEYAGWALALAISIIAWFGRRDVTRYDDGLLRIGRLENSSVTHDQLDRLLTRMTAERTVMHSENKEWLQRIEDKIDSNEDRRSKTEHTIRNTVNSVNLKVAVLASKAGVVLPASED